MTLDPLLEGAGAQAEQPGIGVARGNIMLRRQGQAGGVSRADVVTIIELVAMPAVVLLWKYTISLTHTTTRESEGDHTDDEM